MEYVSTDKACKPAGHYSQAIVHKGLVYVSGQLAVDRDGVNRVYSDYFGDHRPARAVVPTRELHHGFRVEIEAIAAVAEG